MTEVLPSFQRKIFHMVGKTAFDASIAIIWGSVLVFQKIWNISIFRYGEKIRLFVDKIAAEMSKLHLHHTKDFLRKMLSLHSACPWESLWQTYFVLAKIKILFFRTLEILRSCVKFFSVGLSVLLSTSEYRQVLDNVVFLSKRVVLLFNSDF